ncbi:pentatricopeptide repeat-containing protein At1g61870, mitochondrial-like [Sesamum indicum]|uniref:Pentatricopeptide repeat-containing protein At1g61870, mitochondrial-like n=1 Tax=Sesamum indicum TaxID=4182 RepID=A0A6I9UDT0_SESIN|nr:pentatricopeptide repeat-containing protein At1g61870, mitochondrial-like [Sesamum indicum]
MALRCRLRSLILQQHRLFSTSNLSSNSKTLQDRKEKARAALYVICSEQNPERVVDICRSTALSPESHLDRLAYSRAISKLKESNNYEGIRAFIKDSIKQLTCRSERFVSYFLVLYGQGGLVKDAVKLFDEMPEMGIERNVKTLNSLLTSCILAGEYGEMKRVFTEFPGKYGLEPNLDTYNVVLKGLCKSGSANEAHSILAEMERKKIKPNTTTFVTAIGGIYEQGNYIDVGKMMQLMKKYGIEPGMSIYNVRIQSLCKLKRSAEAKALFDALPSRGMKPTCGTYGHLIYGFCREGKLDVAKSLYKKMVDRGLQPEAQCYFTLVYYLCQGQDFDAALGICKDCMSKGWVPNITTMKSLVDGLVRIEKVDDAREIIRRVKEKFSRNADRWSEIEAAFPK